jgi:hypothetical protein
MGLGNYQKYASQRKENTATMQIFISMELMKEVSRLRYRFLHMQVIQGAEVNASLRKRK